MKKVLRNIVSFLLPAGLLLTACVREVLPGVDGSDGEWVIPFKAAVSSDISISTKSTMTDAKTESDIYNLYVMVFDNSGNKLFGHYFDRNSLNKTTEDNYWEVTKSAQGEFQSGTVHLKSSKNTTCDKSTIVIISNLNAEMVNITPEQMGTVKNMAELQQIRASLLQLILSRSGYFPMCGTVTNVNLSAGTISLTDPINLRRLDTKIKFEVRAAKDKDIYDFVPVSWQVFNLPKHCVVLPGDTDSATAAADFFDGNELNFETETLTGDEYSNRGTGEKKKICTHGFSFYMMENRKAPKANPTIWEYKHRDEKSGNTFTYANDLATYVVLKGRITFKTSAGAITHAEVKYVIHLGDFGTNVKNFSIERNRSYTYNISIEGINDIKAYVTSTEDPVEPGASGEIVVPLRKLYTCDSHYNTIAIDFYYSDLKDRGGQYAWWVNTPFSGGVERVLKSDGKFYDAEGNEVSIASDAVDYNWVEFRVNGKTAGGNYAANTWMPYKPHPGDASGKTYLLPELLTYLAGQVALFDDPTTRADSDFDNQTDATKAKITVTGFVNEYFYEKDPSKKNASYDPTLWKKFVNQPVRTMCLLSTGDVRGESSYVRAAFIIQQYSIQSVYNVKSSDINIGWGAEFMTDGRELQCNRGKSNKEAYSPNPNGTGNRGNTDPDNGRWDTFIEWGLITDSDPTFQEKDWADYVNLTDGNENNPYMTATGKYLRYACMSRNRDNNGDGKIDKDEVRWYMAASNQLINLYLGSYGIESEAALYQRSAEDRNTNSEFKWRHHIVGSDVATFSSSGKNSDQDCRIVWAEEGPTGSWLSKVSQQHYLTVRCVRNFGKDVGGDPSHGLDVTYSSETVTPDPLIVVKQIYKNPNTGEEREYTENNWNDNKAGWNLYKDVYLDIDCSRINEKSRRYYTDRELAPHNEFNEAACLFEHFQTTTVAGSKKWNTKWSVQEINEKIDEKGENEYCPEGYRLPNVRELGVICYYFDHSEMYVRSDPETNGKKSYFTFARTKLSFGVTDKQFTNEANKWGWAVGNDGYYRAIAARNDTDTHRTLSIRCVKDVKKQDSN